MSDPYFPPHNDSAGTQVLVPPQPTQQGYDYGPPPTGGYPTPGYAPDGQPPIHGPHHHRSTPTSALMSVPGRVRGMLAVLAVLVVALGGYGVMTHQHLGESKTRADGLNQSLSKAKDSVAAKQSELEQTKKDLKTSKAENAQATAALETVATCASGLYEAWNAYFAKDYKAAEAALSESKESCQQAFGDSGGDSTTQ